MDRWLLIWNNEFTRYIKYTSHILFRSMHTLVIHGGAGNITPAIMNKEQEEQYTEGLKMSLNKGYDILKNGGTALDAVVASIMEMEDNPLFNAGKGAVFTKKGLH